MEQRNNTWKRCRNHIQKPNLREEYVKLRNKALFVLSTIVNANSNIFNPTFWEETMKKLKPDHNIC